MTKAQSVGDLIRTIKAQRIQREGSNYENAPSSIYDRWQQLTEAEQSWQTLSLTSDELAVLACIQRIHSKQTAGDLIYMVKNRSTTEQLARKLGIEEK